MSASLRQEFCVRWNSHLGSIGASFPQLLAGQRFVDVTLACEGHQVHCHRLVLAACSSYFESILAENPCKHPVVILPSEIKLWEIQALVDFMYKGEVNVTQAGLPQLLRCAEQLRIKGLYGSDAALNLNQLKAMTHKAAAAASMGLAAGGGAPQHDDTDDTGTNSTTTTSTSAHTASSALATAPEQQQLMIKKELAVMHTPNGMGHLTNAQQQQPQQSQQHTLQQQHYPTRRELRSTLAVAASTPHAADDLSADESSSHANYEQFEYDSKAAVQHPLMNMDSNIEDDHTYVAAHDEDDSFGAVDTEHETTANSSTLTPHNASALDASGSFKRVRRSEASLAQAAKCVSKGETFQTVSNMFNIPVSTIRFYMARKGILPKRKRGRGASSANSAAASAMAAAAAALTSNAAMSQALAQLKRSPSLDSVGYQHAGMGYKLNDKQGAAHMI